MFATYHRLFAVVAILSALAMPLQADAEVQWSVEKTFKTGQQPLDVAITPDGSSVFVLIEGGSILVYDRQGRQEDAFNVGAHIDQIRIDPSGEKLFATSRQNQTVEIIALDFIRQINVKGSPTKGPADAGVTLAVFSDFQ